MGDNQNYYYIKLKDNYFEQDSIKILESQTNGHTYSLILIKLYLKACKYDGQLKMNNYIPYSSDENDLETLSKVINHDRDHVKEALNFALKFGLITIINSRELWMNEIQNFIGKSSSEADRKRKYRTMLEGQMSGQISDKYPPEKEKEKEKEKEINETALTLSYSLFDEIMKNTAPTKYKNKKPNLTNWSFDIEKLNRIDGVIWKEIQEMIVWSTSHDFWGPNILSGANLRKHYTQLELQKKKDFGNQEPKELDAYEISKKHGIG